MPTTVQAKAKIRERHRTGIAKFKAWLLKNPKATRKQRYNKFDYYIDGENR